MSFPPQWLKVRMRINELDRLINSSNQVRVAWFQERAHLRETGRLDWVDPNPMQVRPASDLLLPPAPRPR